MKTNILTTNNKFKEKYVNKFFTEDGWKALFNYTKALAKEYIKKKNNAFYVTPDDFPLRIGIVFGIPFFKWAHEFKTLDELEGRIKGNMQLLGVEEIAVKIGLDTHVICFKGG